tara:strand:- start:150 stop:359 length:210 start_codon:yes stop_codon:yes gene_type:complete
MSGKIILILYFKQFLNKHLIYSFLLSVTFGVLKKIIFLDIKFVDTFSFTSHINILYLFFFANSLANSIK